MNPMTFKEFCFSVVSDSGQGSASRILMLVFGFVSCVCLMHVVWHNHALPDALTMGGLGGFSTSPYIWNQMKAGVAAFAPAPPKP